VYLRRVNSVSKRDLFKKFPGKIFEGGGVAIFHCI